MLVGFMDGGHEFVGRFVYFGVLFYKFFMGGEIGRSGKVVIF